MSATCHAAARGERTGRGDEHTDDEAVNGDNTRHDDGNNRLDGEVGAEDGGGRNSDARLGSAVGGAER